MQVHLQRAHDGTVKALIACDHLRKPKWKMSTIEILKVKTKLQN